MSLTAQQLVKRATEIAHAPGFGDAASDFLNSDPVRPLPDLRPGGRRRGFFSFNFVEDLIAGGTGGTATLWGEFNWGQANWGATTGPSMIGGQSIGASGPYALPLDYLRTSGSSGSEGTQKSTFWLLNGVPYPMIPCDLAEFDMQVQQVGVSAFPWLWATDMAQRVIAEQTQANWTAGSTLVTNVQNTNNITVGMTALGPGLVIGTTIAAMAGNTLTLSQAAGQSAVLLAPLMIGFPGVGYAYPPPSGAFSVSMRYQRQMQDIYSPGTSNIIPWFPNDRYLLKQLSAMVMDRADDDRATAFYAEAFKILDPYLKMKDDMTNRTQSIGLDRRRFGQPYPFLRNTKTVGW